MGDHRKPTVAFWTTVFLVAAGLYMAGFGPACWLLWRPWCPSAAVELLPVIYWPITWLIQSGPDPIRDAFIWYEDIWEAVGR
jgi:hypothetical protein